MSNESYTELDLEPEGASELGRVLPVRHDPAPVRDARLAPLTAGDKAIELHPRAGFRHVQTAHQKVARGARLDPPAWQRIK